jgi:uncharacterized protein YndB with AHSA1/START domain
VDERKDSAAAAATPAPQYKKDVTITRVFDAARELVFRAWTDAKHMQQWWGPHGFTNPRCEVDARPGGEMRIDMRAPDGTVYPMTATFREVVPPEKIVFISAALDQNGAPMFEILNTVTFADEHGKTRVTLHAQVLNAGPQAPMHLAGMEMGWNQTLDRLGAFVTGKKVD